MSKEKNLVKLAVIHALVLSIINFLVFLGVFYFVPRFMESNVFSLAKLIWGLGIPVFFCFYFRNRIGGYWSFTEALKGIFNMLFIASLFLFFLVIGWEHMMGSAYSIKMKEITAVQMKNALEWMQATQEQIEVEQSKIDQAFDQKANFSIKFVLKMIPVLAMVNFLLAIILAVVFKKVPPKQTI